MISVTARRVVEQAIGEKLDGSPLDKPMPSGHVSAARRASGRKGGPARARKMTAAKRSDIARIAAEARWKKSR